MGIFHLFLMLTTLLEALPQSDASDLTKIAQSVPTEDNYYIYDIIGELSSADIINGFGDLNQVYRFKVLGGRRFIILVKVVDENGAKYFDLKLPRASTIMAYAVERNGQYAEYFGVNGTLDQELIPFPDKGLNLAEFTVVEKGVDLDTLKKNMKNAEREGKGFINKDKFHVRSFHVTGTFPIKFIVFMTAPTYVLDRLALEWAKNFGDPSQSILKVTPIRNI